MTKLQVDSMRFGPWFFYRTPGVDVNRYSGVYTVVGDVLTIGHAISTMSAGEEPATKIEQEFMGIIAQPLTISVISGEVLAKSPQGTLLLVPQAR